MCIRDRLHVEASAPRFAIRDGGAIAGHVEQKAHHEHVIAVLGNKAVSYTHLLNVAASSAVAFYAFRQLSQLER